MEVVLEVDCTLRVVVVVLGISDTLLVEDDKPLLESARVDVKVTMVDVVDFEGDVDKKVLVVEMANEETLTAKVDTKILLSVADDDGELGSGLLANLPTTRGDVL